MDQDEPPRAAVTALCHAPATWPRDDGTRGRLVKTWPYLSAQGELLGFTARYHFETGSAKDVIPFFKRDERGQFRAGAAPVPRPLFGLDTLNRPGPLFITEGEKDAAALHCIGFAAVTSPGGGKAADKADWPALQPAMDTGRTVLCWPDHDAPGRVYVATVAGLLGSACECLVSLPEGTPNVAGAGAADWLAAALTAAGQKWDGLNPPALTPEAREALRVLLEGAVEAVRGPLPPDWTPHQAAAKAAVTHYRGADDGPPGYVATDRGIIRVYGEKESQLSNFTARIVEEVLHDDGTQENTRMLTIHGTRDGAPLPPAALSLDEFNGMNWPVKHWGTGCMVNPGQGARDHLKFAIQYLSHRGATPINRTVFNHTGWREIDRAWVYLSAGAVIGADGPVEGIDVDLGDLGDLYRLPPPSCTPEQRREAATASMEAATIAPPEVAIPLIACVYLAPFAQQLGVDLAVWLEGPSRSMKSTLAAVMAAHFGAGAERTALAASWLDTAKSISHRLFVLADGLAVIDDYAPQASAGDQAKIDRTVHEVLRGIGNRVGRGRLTSDIKLQTRRPPRALALSTAEQYLHGESISARLFGVTMTPRSLDMERLNRAQAAAKAGTLARAMADYLSTVARDFVRCRDAARADWQRLRDEAMTAGLCGRTPDQVAFLLIGYGKALNHWQGAGLLSPDTKITMFTEARRVLYELAKIHERRIASAQPADTFVSILADLLLSGEAYLRGTDDQKPAVHPDRYGWRADGASGAHIGWVDEGKEELYLLREAALAAIKDRGRRIDNPLNISSSALLRQLKDRGFLLTGDEEQRDGKSVDRTSRVKRIGNKTVRVLVLPLSVLDHEGGD
jgi:hypothetical protein